ncbi:MAG: hypothetical protein QN198_06165 [Armatimonadota bacterium]|nr:hypothetical protein [Armatimonadota bacterium]MDR5703171.1 hypothetical protein [Armatimonadota bacterium]MDR7435004.1 hypothetical protein [Armatimonadota bacterium]
MSMELFTFPQAPSRDAVEWPGTPIGKGNVITRTKSRTVIFDKSIDRQEGRRDELVKAAVAHMAAAGERESLFLGDVVIHGIRVRCFTNSPHLIDFWMDNWYSPEEWREVTGHTPPREPQVTVYALCGVDQEEAAYYSRNTNTIVFFNTSYYGQLKSWVLGAVGRVLAEEYGIHSIHGACVEKAGKGVLYIAPTGTGKSTSVYGLASFPDARFHSDDWVYVRYTFRTRDGRRIAPTLIGLPSGEIISGYRVFRWLEENARTYPQASVVGLDLGNASISLSVVDLDLDQPVEAYAYTSEKIFYLRTNLVESFPLSVSGILRAKMENVPDVTLHFLEQHSGMLDELVDALRAAEGEIGAMFRAMSAEEARVLLARLIAFDNARAMLDITQVLPRERVFTNPMEPTRLSTVFLIKRAFEDPVVLESLSLEKFMGRLLIGETPEKKREIAYNAYRAVDDAEEQAFVRRLEEEVKLRYREGWFDRLYEIYREHQDAPETLVEEFELFRMLHKACRCYDLNTILMEAPAVNNKKEAVQKTIELIARVVEEEPAELRLTLADYQAYLSR